jgi:hypothetical protein
VVAKKEWRHGAKKKSCSCWQASSTAEIVCAGLGAKYD